MKQREGKLKRIGNDWQTIIYYRKKEEAEEQQLNKMHRKRQEKTR